MPSKGNLMSSGSDKSDLDTTFSNGRIRGGNHVILKLDGSNFTSWKCLIFALLDSEPFALAVTTGTLIPPTPDEAGDDAGKRQQQQYDAGNRAARCLLFGSLQPSLAVSLFADNSETVEAPEIWRSIIGRFSSTNGGLKQLSLSKLMQYRYQQNKTATENIFRFNQIISHIAALGVAIPDDLKITVLLEALPSSWEPFRQAFTAREDSSKTLGHLVQAVESEALRRGQFDTKEVTALFSKLNTSSDRHNQNRRKKFRRFNGPQRGGSTTNSPNVTCYNCQKKGHIRANCLAPRRTHGQGQDQNRRPQLQHRRRQGNRNHQRQQQSQPQANVSEALVAETLLVKTSPVEINYSSTENEYVVDSGTNFHMCNSKKHLINYTPYRRTREVRLGGSRALSAQGTGTARITFMCDGQPSVILLSEVLYVPRLRRNLISVSKLTDDGFGVQVDRDSIVLTQGNSTVEAKRNNGLYLLYSTNPVEVNAADSKKKVSLSLIHRTLGHINVGWLRSMLKRNGDEVIEDFVGCDDCVAGKMHQASFRSKPASAIAPRIGYINSDVCSVSTPSYGRHNHFVTLTDDLSSFCKIYFIKSKDEVPDCI